MCSCSSCNEPTWLQSHYYGLVDGDSYWQSRDCRFFCAEHNTDNTTWISPLNSLFQTDPELGICDVGKRIGVSIVRVYHTKVLKQLLAARPLCPNFPQRPFDLVWKKRPRPVSVVRADLSRHLGGRLRLTWRRHVGRRLRGLASICLSLFLALRWWRQTGVRVGSKGNRGVRVGRGHGLIFLAVLVAAGAKQKKTC